MPAPKQAREYYNLPENAMFRDVILSIRADEAIHRELNHHFAGLRPDQDIEHEEVFVIEKEKHTLKEEQ